MVNSELRMVKIIAESATKALGGRMGDWGDSLVGADG